MGCAPGNQVVINLSLCRIFHLSISSWPVHNRCVRHVQLLQVPGAGPPAPHHHGYSRHWTQAGLVLVFTVNTLILRSPVQVLIPEVSFSF